MFAQNAVINASYNYWGTIVDTEVRARIRDKYDNVTLFEIAYSPAVDQYKLRDGKCELGWTLIDDTCYTYVGSYVTYREAETICKKFESRLARETVAPIKLPRFRKLARTSQFEYETQSYRKIWLHSDALIGIDLSVIGVKCSVIDDYGSDWAPCNDRLPFICEKDPLFLGATFRFKDEIAFAMAACAALVIIILLLCLLWFYKSRKRKKEHIDRQNTLRTSARTHRHMIGAGSSLSQFSTLSSSQAQVNKSGAIYSGSNFGNTSMDSLSMSGTRSNAMLMSRSGRSLYGQIYNSQRNQYFRNKSRNPDEINEEDGRNRMDESRDDELKSSPPSIFIASGLDSKQSTAAESNGVNFYGENDGETATLANNRQNQSIQYHMLDPSNNTNKSSINKYTLPDSVDSPLDDQTNTTNTSESDEATSSSATTHLPRYQRHHRTDVSPSQRDSGVAVSESTLEKQFIQARLIKSSALPKQSTPNLDPTNRRGANFSSYDKLMNTTLTTDTDDDQDANSKRLLTHKTINSRAAGHQPSSFKPMIYEPGPTTRSDLQSGSMLSNATNMTSVTPLANVSLQNVPGPIGIQYSSSDYENLSNTAINNILDNYPPKSRVPVVADRKKPPPPVAYTQPRPPAPPPSRPPPIYSQGQHREDDDESLVSCQLITSASLLMNRDLVKEARHVTAQAKNAPIQPSNPRSGGVNVGEAAGVGSMRKPGQDAVVQVQTDVDATKPPPMETAI